MITQDKMGGRRVDLFIPFEYNGQKYESITFAALRFGHVLLWGEGHWGSMLSLMAELAGVDEAVIRELRFPDADRATEAFMSQLTLELRTDIIEGRIPLKNDPERFMVQDPEEEATEAHTPETTNGSGQPPQTPVGPGVPLPPPDEPVTGFDLSEEP